MKNYGHAGLSTILLAAAITNALIYGQSSEQGISKVVDPEDEAKEKSRGVKAVALFGASAILSESDAEALNRYLEEREDAFSHSIAVISYLGYQEESEAFRLLRRIRTLGTYDLLMDYECALGETNGSPYQHPPVHKPPKVLI